MAEPFTNPFFGADFAKNLGDFKFPGFNFEALLAAQRRNIEAITAVNQAAIEGVQALARRQADLVRQSVEEATGVVNAIISSPTPEEKVIRQAEASKAAVDRCLANARDVTETLTKCNAQALEVVSTRLNEGLEELRGIIKTSKAA